VIEWPPTASADVLSEAEPPESGDVPSDVAPSKNSTLPLGLPEPGGFTETVALIVTLSPTTDGFGDVVTAVAVLAASTTCVCAGDVLVGYVPSPL
jgi:hypothetical protein